MLSLALVALGSTVTFNAPYSGIIDYRLSISRPGLGSSSDGMNPDLRELGWQPEHAAKFPRVEEMLRSAASGGLACPASLTTNDMQMYSAWRDSLDAHSRAQADSALVLIRQADLDAQEDAERAEMEREGAGVFAPEPELTDNQAWVPEVVIRNPVYRG